MSSLTGTSDTGLSPTGPSDAELLAAHVDGDPDAFAELVRRHRARLWAVAMRTVRDPEEAADALQDGLISAFRRADSFRGDAAVTTWLHRIVVNACLDRLRRAKVRLTEPLPDHDIAEQRDHYRETDAHLDVHAALARLPEAQRMAIVLVDLQELSVAEAAEVLDVAAGTVKSRCSRGRAALAEWLSPDDPAQAGNQDDVTPVPPTPSPPGDRTASPSRTDSPVPDPEVS